MRGAGRTEALRKERGGRWTGWWRRWRRETMCMCQFVQNFGLEISINVLQSSALNPGFTEDLFKTYRTKATPQTSNRSISADGARLGCY